LKTYRNYLRATKRKQARRTDRHNAHGDVVRTIGSDRITVTTYDYDAFGNDRNTANALISDQNPFRYCGEYFDTATGTYFLRARWYDPATGRFTQQDSWAYYNPNDPLSLNLYVYCYGNPVGYVDPSGNTVIVSSENDDYIIEALSCINELTEYELFYSFSTNELTYKKGNIAEETPIGNELIATLIYSPHTIKIAKVEMRVLFLI